MISNFLIELVKTIALSIMTNVQDLVNPIEALQDMTYLLGRMITITTQANNFIHFIVGDFIIVLLPATIFLIGIKYTIYPIIQFFISFFRNSNN